MEKPKLSFKFVPEVVKRPIHLWHLHASLELVAGYQGPRHKKSRMRRYLRVRTKMLHVAYYVWNGRDKGDLVRYVRNIHILKKLTSEEVQQHYGKGNLEV